MFVAPFAAPFPSPVASSGAAAVPWYLAGGVAAANCKAAYQPIGAASLAASYTNLANPGTYDAAPGTAPTFATGTGWTFNGTSQYLNTGITPVSGGSMIVRFSGGSSTGDRCLIGCDVWSNPVVWLLHRWASVNPNIVSYGNGAYVTPTGALNSGVLCVAGNQGYRDGSANGTTIGAWSGSMTQTLVIAARQEAGVKSYFYAGDIQAVAVYDTTLTGAQVAAITTAMQALTG